MAATLTTRPDARGLDALAAVVALMRQQIATLQQEVSALKAAEAKRRKPTIKLLRRLLPALAGSFGSNVWRATDALAHPALRPLLRGWDARRLGIFLANKATGVVVDGLVLERIGHEGHVALWKVVGVLPE
jgi:hypothetical protein